MQQESWKIKDGLKNTGRDQIVPIDVTDAGNAHCCHPQFEIVLDVLERQADPGAGLKRLLHHQIHRFGGGVGGNIGAPRRPRPGSGVGR